MNIGNNIKKYRTSKKMTQRELSELLGVKVGTISKYESGMLEPNIKSLKSLSELFEISVDMLLKEEEENYIPDTNVLEILREQRKLKIKGNLYHNTQIIFAYNTNHIEGSRLTSEQTRYIYETNSILFEENTIANVDDIIETINHFKLVDYMLDVAEKDLTEDMIKEFHRILKDGTLDSRKEYFNVGDYKKVENEAGLVKTIAPKSVSKYMKNLLDWYNSLKEVKLLDIIEFHARFEKIHPFQDGNGRVGRIIMFKECLKNNIIPFIILDEDKLFYYRGLREYQENKEKGYLIDTCLYEQDEYIKLMKHYLKKHE